MRRKGHPYVSLGWAPEGTRRRGRPKDTWRRVALKRLAAAGMKSWREAAVVAQDRCEWKSAGRRCAEGAIWRKLFSKISK